MQILLITLLLLSALLVSIDHNAHAGPINVDHMKALPTDSKGAASTKDMSTDIVGVSDEIVAELRKAAQDEKLWWEAMRNTHAYLRERHLEVPSHITLSLYDAAWDTKVPIIHAAEFDADSRNSNCGTLRHLSPDSECTPGYRPIKTVKKVKQCVKYGIAVIGKEWVITVEGTPRGHWEYETVTKCLLAIETEVTVTACLPILKVFGEPVPSKPGQ